MRKPFIVVALLTILSGCGSGSSDKPSTPVATITTLAANQIVFDSDRTGNHEIFVMKTDGSLVQQLTHDSAYENWWARISPDRKKILFYRSPAGKPENYSEASLWLMNADGTGVTQLRAKGDDGWTLQG